MLLTCLPHVQVLGTQHTEEQYFPQHSPQYCDPGDWRHTSNCTGNPLGMADIAFNGETVHAENPLWILSTAELAAQGSSLSHHEEEVDQSALDPEKTFVYKPLRHIPQFHKKAAHGSEVS